MWNLSEYLCTHSTPNVWMFNQDQPPSCSDRQPKGLGFSKRLASNVGIAWWSAGSLYLCCFPMFQSIHGSFQHLKRKSHFKAMVFANSERELVSNGARWFGSKRDYPAPQTNPHCFLKMQLHVIFSSLSLFIYFQNFIQFGDKNFCCISSPSFSPTTHAIVGSPPEKFALAYATREAPSARLRQWRKEN